MGQRADVATGAREARKFDPANAAALDAPERDRYLPAEAIVRLLGLAGEETVIDYGSGTGRLALAAAAQLPRGRVIAIEESPEMLEHLRARTREIANVDALLTADNRVPLTDAVADRIMAVNVLHEVRGESALTEMRRLLAPSGALLVVDWERGRARPSGPPDSLLYDAGEAVAELRSAGLDAVEIAAGLPYHFAIRAVRGAPAPSPSDACASRGST